MSEKLHSEDVDVQSKINPVMDEFTQIGDEFTQKFKSLCEKYNINVGRYFDDKDYKSHKIKFIFNFDELVNETL